MATIRREVQIRVPSNRVWDAVRDVGALHTRLAPGLVTDTRLDGDSRIVTFANGMALRELIVSVDDDDHRLVWSAVGPPFSHHNGSLQVFDQGGGSRAEWVADLLPHDMKDMVAGIMEQGLDVMKRTLEAEVGGDPMPPDSVTSQEVVRAVGVRQQTAKPGNIFGSHSEPNEPEMQTRVPRRTRSPSLHHLSLFVTDLEASTKFYTDGLGLKPQQPFRDIVGRRHNTAFRFGLPSVFLETANGCYVELHPAGGGGISFPTFPLNHFALRMADVDAAYEQALKSGAKPVDIPVVSGSWDGSPLDVIMDGDHPEPIRMAFVLGPNSEIIEIYQKTNPASFRT